MNTLNKTAAKALVECGYCKEFRGGESPYIVHGKEDDLEYIDYHHNHEQMLALLQFFLSPDKSLTLTGDGHLSAEEQILNYIDEQLNPLSGREVVSEHL